MQSRGRNGLSILAHKKQICKNSLETIPAGRPTRSTDTLLGPSDLMVLSPRRPFVAPQSLQRAQYTCTSVVRFSVPGSTGRRPVSAKEAADLGLS